MAAFDAALFDGSLRIESFPWTKPLLSQLPTGKGVLLFADAAERPIQLLQAASLRRTAQAKLLQEDDTALRPKADISGLTHTLHYTCCDNAFELQMAYIRLAHSVFGSAANAWIQLPRLGLAAIETDAALPFFYLTENPRRTDRRSVFGLFATRKAAGEFCEALNTVFGLCRNCALLGSGKEASCPYRQMGTCPGPCLDASQRTAYFNAVGRACEAAAGQLDRTGERLNEQMKTAAAAMRFEEAAVLKKQIQRLKKLAGPDFRWVHDLRDLRIVHMDVGSKRKLYGKTRKQQLYKAWIITADQVEALGVCVPHSAGQVRSFLHRAGTQRHAAAYAVNAKEHLAAVSLFLFRSNPGGLWLDGSCGSQIGWDEKLRGFFGF